MPTNWDWTGATAEAQRRQDGNSTGSTEAVRELSELQLGYHSLVSSIMTNNLLGTLQGSPALSSAMSATVLVCF
jgi:hypothetical protein